MAMWALHMITGRSAARTQEWRKQELDFIVASPPQGLGVTPPAVAVCLASALPK